MEEVVAQDATTKRSWLQVEERGSSLGLRLLLGVVFLFGRTMGRGLLYPITLYFALRHADLRRDSKAYLRRMGIDPTFGSIYRHTLRFSQCALDRVFFLKGEKDRFALTMDGHETVVELHERRVGAIFLGAHLGSFEAMRMVSSGAGVPLNVVMNNANAKRVRRLIHALDPEGSLRILETGEGGARLALQIREAVDRGEIVAILGDRVTEGERSARASFLGDDADFPVGPYLIAAALGCPVYLTFGLYRGGNRYDLYCERFADRIVLERPRDESLQRWVARYASRLEHYCRLAPDNWFNFFDFWSTHDVPKQ